MLVDVETFLLYTLAYTQTMKLLDAIEQDEATGSSPEVNHEDTKHLCAKEAPTKTVACAIGGRQQTCHQSTKDTAYTMY